MIVLAGPNGAGKSTIAPTLLAETLGVLEFVNADVIAQGLSAFRPEQVALEAGRIMLQRLHNLAGRRTDFAFETTLAGRSFASWIADLRRSGHAFHLVFLALPSPEMAVARVQDRVRLGGHAVPAWVVRRRYHAGLRNFFGLYQPLADTWRFYDNSDRSGPRLLAAGSGRVTDTIRDSKAWGRLVKEFEP